MSSAGVDVVVDESRPTDRSWDGLIRWGGWSLVGAAAILVVFVAAVIVTGQELPVPAEEALDNPNTPTALFVLAAVGELLLAPAALALYFALRPAGWSRMLIGTTLLMMSSLLFVVSRGPIISLAQISDNYQDATTESVRTAYLASAEFAIETQNTYSTIAVILLSAASVLIGSVMLQSSLVGRPIAVVTIAAGIASIFAPFLIIAGVPEAIGFIGLALGAVWQFVVGVKLSQTRQDRT